MTAKVELLLIRGLPGSGKTTMAKEYAQAGYVHCEADQYFEINGEYRFDSNKLRAAHVDCLRRAIAAMDAGRSVVVANTFTRRWEMQPYLKAAKKRGINVRIVEATGNWPSVHGVPVDAIERMRARYEAIGVGPWYDLCQEDKDALLGNMRHATQPMSVRCGGNPSRGDTGAKRRAASVCGRSRSFVTTSIRRVKSRLCEWSRSMPSLPYRRVSR